MQDRSRPACRGDATISAGVTQELVARIAAGDGVFATFDGPCTRGPMRAGPRSRASPWARSGIEVQAGVHTGEVETIDGKAGGTRGDDRGAGSEGIRRSVRGARVLRPCVVWMAGSGLAFEDAGEHELKGMPDSWHLYRVVG